MKTTLIISAVSALLLFSSCDGRKVDGEKSGYYHYSWNERKIYFKKVDIYHTYIPIPTKVNIYEMDADAKTFEVFDDVVAKDKNHVFCWAVEVEFADAASFYRVADDLYKDKNHVFMFESHELNIIEDADPETYARCYDKKYGWAKDKKGYFYMDKRVDVDVSTFEIVSEYNNSAFDKDFVYYTKRYPIHKIAIRGKLTKVNDNLFYDDRQVFRFSWDNGYCLDTLPFRNKKSFVVYDSGENTIFKVGGRLFWNKYEITDRLDVNSFEYPGGSYAKDRRMVYFVRNIQKDNVVDMPSADPATFKVVEGNLARDKQSVYYGLRTIYGADPQTIRKTETGLKDKNYEWEFNSEEKRWDKVAAGRETPTPE